MSVREAHEVLAGISKLLVDEENISAKMMLDENRSKLILLGAASEFEVSLCSIVREFAKSKSDGNELILSLIEKKAIKRQYHTWFAWDSGNANAFYGLFGTEFSTHMKAIAKGDDDFSDAVRGFMEIGQYRNALIHGNFLTVNFPKTAEEVFDTYEKALRFLSRIEQELKSFSPEGPEKNNE